MTTYDYDMFGVSRVTAPDGSLVMIIKDARGRPTFHVYADASGAVRARTETRYYDGDEPRLRVHPDGAVERYSYDLRGRLLRLEYLSGDPEASGASHSVKWTESYRYDQAGNRIHSERRDERGFVTWQQDRAYDMHHRVVWESHPAVPDAGRTWVYDRSGFLTETVDEEARATTFVPDALRRVRKVARAGRDSQGAPVSADVATYQYHPHQATLASVTDAGGRSTEYTYDDFGRIERIASANLGNGGELSFRYDPRGNVVSRSGQGVSMTYLYDGLDRATVVEAASASAAPLRYEYRYDEAPFTGRLTSIVEPDRVVSFTYDWAGRVATEKIAESGVSAGLNTEYEYDASGALRRIGHPSGLKIEFDRDPATRQITAVSDASTGAQLATGISRYPWGAISSLTFGNGLTLAQRLNGRYEPVALQSGPVDLAYGATPSGDIGTMWDRSQEPNDCARNVTRAVSYDFLERVASWSDTVGTGAGACPVDSIGGVAAAFSYVSGTDLLAAQLTPDASRPVLGFGHDRQGNVSAVAQYDASEGAISLALCLRHDAMNRMVLAGRTTTSVTPGGIACESDAAVSEVLARFKYDAGNRRIAREIGGAWTYVVSDRMGNPLSELALSEGTWRKVRDYVWLDGLLLAQIEYAGAGAGEVYYAHLDHLGTPRALTNRNGQVVWSVYQRPNGEVLEKTRPDPVTGQTVVTNLRLPGQYDERLFAQAGISGLQGPYYNWNRWYLPSVGRYMELDPLALRGAFNGFFGPNWYGYAEGNPLKWVDPWGLTVTCVYHQATGQLTCTDDQTGQQVVNNTGYAGHGPGVNNPNMQCVQNTGPLPTGTYTIGQAVNSPNTGPVSLPLTPSAGDNMCGRNAFRIHGNNSQNNQSASQGCIIMPPAVRNTINNSGGGTLTVQP